MPIPTATLTRSEFSTTDPDAVYDTCRAMFGSDVSIFGSAQPWHFGMRVADASTFAVLNVSLSAEYSFHIDGHDSILIETLREGRLETTDSDRERRHAAGDVFMGKYPDADYDGHCFGGNYHVVAVPARLIRTVAGLPDDARLNIRSVALPAPATARWHPVAQLAEEVLADPITAASPLLLASLGRVVAAAALDLLPTTEAPPPRPADPHDSHPTTLRRAIAFIEAHPDHDIGIADIAHAAHVTPRAVQLAFRRHQDTIPMAYLRRVRLDRAHADLTTAAPDNEDTVAAIAARWGFANPDRFNYQCRNAYGETPSSTLHR